MFLTVRPCHLPPSVRVRVRAPVWELKPMAPVFVKFTGPLPEASMMLPAVVLTLEIVRSDGQAAYQENITLKPPVLSDTTAAIKNSLSFQKRISLPDGTYTVRGLVRDQYQAGRQACNIRS